MDKRPSETNSNGSRRQRNTRIIKVIKLLSLVASVLVVVSIWRYSSLIYSATKRLQLPRLEELKSRNACHDETLPVKNIAIIGAGAAGASTAYYLSQLISPCQPLNVTMFESNSYIGGRSTTVNLYANPSSPTAELGASIFVEANRNLVSAVHNLGLSLSKPFDIPPDMKYDLGVWDGLSFRFLVEQDEPEWKLIPRLLWRYGLAPLRLQSLKKTVIDRFLKMYSEPVFPWRFLNDAVAELDLVDVTAVDGYALLMANGVSADYARDVVQASTRVNYAANLKAIHGLETLVSMAAEGGAMSIEGGNWQIFEGMVAVSGAALLLNTTVSSITHDDGRFAVSWDTTDSEVPNSQSPAETNDFDAVVLAAPWHQSKIQVVPPPTNTPPEVEYVELHVTIFTSPYRLSRAYWGGMQDPVPGTVLTTLPGDFKAERELRYLSISVLRSARNPDTGATELAYKVFSLAPLPKSFFGQILETSSASDAKEAVSWMYEKVWQSYPVLHPTSAFYGPEMILPKTRSSSGFWYTSGMEPFISTMETSSLAGKNVAALMVEHFSGSGAADGGQVEDMPDSAGSQVPVDTEGGEPRIEL